MANTVRQRAAAHQFTTTLAHWRAQGRPIPPQYADLAHLRVAHPTATLAQLGQLYDPPLSKHSVAGRLRRLGELIGVPHRIGPTAQIPQIRSEERKNLAEQVATAYAQGASIRDVAVRLHLSYGAVRKLLSESDSPARARGASTTCPGLTKHEGPQPEPTSSSRLESV